MIKEVADAHARGKPVMLLLYEDDSAFCNGALQCALNTNAAAKLAKDSFVLVKVDVRTLRDEGIDKKYGAKAPHIAFITPGGKVVARFAEPNASAQAFIGFLDDVAAKTKKAVKAEEEARAKALARAEKEAAKKAALAKADKKPSGKATEDAGSGTLSNSK